MTSIQLLKTLLYVMVCVSWAVPDAGAEPADPASKVTIATQAAPYSGLNVIALEKGYFKAAGLAVTLALYPSGKEAVEAMDRGEAQLATLADIAFAAKILQESSVRVLASIGTSTGSQIIARKDKNIKTPADLRGKRVGFTADTTSDYFLHTFLLTENIAPEEIVAVNIPAGRQAEALLKDEVDAVSAFEIFAFEAKKKLGPNAISWDAQNNLAFHWLLTANKSNLEKREPPVGILKALVQAETFARENEAEAKRILIQRWAFSQEFLEQSWPKTRLNVTFGQSIVISLQNHMALQLKKKNNSMAAPDVLSYLYPEILDEVAPKSVTLFR